MFRHSDLWLMYPPVCALAREATDPHPINTLSAPLSVSLSQVSPAPTSSSGPLWAPFSSSPSSWLWLPGVTSECHWSWIQLNFIFDASQIGCLLFKLSSNSTLAFLPAKSVFHFIPVNINPNQSWALFLLLFTGATNRDAMLSQKFTESSAGLSSLTSFSPFHQSCSIQLLWFSAGTSRASLVF